MFASAATPIVRRADPYHDTDIIDARAPRFNQTIVATVSLLAVGLGWWPLLGVLAAQLALGLRFGRRYCVPCVLYFELVQPRFGEGPLEDSRPPRFANLLGAIFLGAATLAYALGSTAIGATLGLIVAALATLAATTGRCVGCELYKIDARIRGIRSHVLDRIDPGDLDTTVARAIVEFTHPLCTECQRLARDLEGRGERVLTIDVSRRPELARKYGIAVVPVAVRIEGDGRVVERIAG
ncbi:MAG TPA: hypothetical protein DCK98_07345 [Chloroflexi bacterium]|jgi:hypothetical protein|nr:hypothetical protein [Chloroflexota bacterium]HAL25577.1 hypothetical protein [Chloroflexota bacterium]